MQGGGRWAEGEVGSRALGKSHHGKSLPLFSLMHRYLVPSRSSFLHEFFVYSCVLVGSCTLANWHPGIWHPSCLTVLLRLTSHQADIPVQYLNRRAQGIRAEASALSVILNR